MMTHIQFLLVKLAEECNEAGQRALKQAQFGAQQQQKGCRKNRDRLRGEVLDILAHVQFLQEARELDYISKDDIDAHARKKWRKMMRFKGVSKRRGLVQ